MGRVVNGEGGERGGWPMGRVASGRVMKGKGWRVGGWRPGGWQKWPHLNSDI